MSGVVRFVLDLRIRPHRPQDSITQRSAPTAALVPALVRTRTGLVPDPQPSALPRQRRRTTPGLDGRSSGSQPRAGDACRKAELDHMENLDTPVIREMFARMLDNWTNEGFDPFATRRRPGPPSASSAGTTARQSPGTPSPRARRRPTAAISGTVPGRWSASTWSWRRPERDPAAGVRSRLHNLKGLAGFERCQQVRLLFIPRPARNAAGR
jgi:hypothetical protein